jgi:hypothetical protein
MICYLMHRSRPFNGRNECSQTTEANGNEVKGGAKNIKRRYFCNTIH